jgi:hypothetical protein
LRIEKLLEVNPEFGVVAAGRIDEGSTVLRGHFHGTIEQRL